MFQSRIVTVVGHLAERAVTSGDRWNGGSCECTVVVLAKSPLQEMTDAIATRALWIVEHVRIPNAPIIEAFYDPNIGFDEDPRWWCSPQVIGSGPG